MCRVAMLAALLLVAPAVAAGPDGPVPAPAPEAHGLFPPALPAGPLDWTPMIAPPVLGVGPTTGPADGWVVAGGVNTLLLTPRFESNPAYTVTLLRPGGLVTARTYRVAEFSYSPGLSPEVWLAAQSPDNGIGVRLGWWFFDQSAKPKTAVNLPIPPGDPIGTSLVNSVSPLLAIYPPNVLPAVTTIQRQGVPGAPVELAFQNETQFNVWDVDVTFADLTTGPWRLTGFGGVRYGRVEQTYAAFSGGPIPQTLVSGRQFIGLGPTAGVDARRPLGISGLALTAGARFSFLVGSDTHVSRGINLGLIPPFALTFHDDASERQRFLPTFDLNMGVEWCRAVGPAELVVSAGGLARGWPLGGGANGNGNMGVIGFQAGAGLRY